MKPVRQQTDAELAYNVQDLREVIAIWDRPQCAGQNPKLPQYIDELHDCLAERNRRTHGQRVVVEIPADLAARLGLVPAVG
jgi:hypothetical protein